MFKVLTKISGAIDDITKQVYRLDGSGKNITVQSGDCLYLGARFKFNHAYFSLAVPAISNCVGAVSVWNGAAFTEVGNTQDWTAGLTESNVIQFTPDKNKGSWQISDTDKIQELSSVLLYGLNWVKITFSATQTLELDYIGHKFSDDVDLFARYPMLNSAEIKSYFEGTSYEEQHIIAAEAIETELMRMNVIDGIEQVLTIDRLKYASVTKVAAIIYGSCGTSFAEKADMLEKQFLADVNNSFPIIDKNNNAIVDGNARIQSGRLYR